MQTLVIDLHLNRSRIFDPEIGVYERRFGSVFEVLRDSCGGTTCSRHSAAQELLAGVRSIERSQELRLLVLCAASEALAASGLLATVEAVAAAESKPGQACIGTAAVLERAVAGFWSLTNGPTASVRLRLAAELSNQTIAICHAEANRCEFVVMRNGASLQEHARSFVFTTDAALDALACCLGHHEALLAADALFLSGEHGALLGPRLASVGPPVAVVPDARHAALVGGAVFLQWQADLPE